MLTNQLQPGWQGRVLLLVPLGVYLFVFPIGLILLAFGLMPTGAAWVGGALLIAQGCAMLVWLALNFGPARGLAAGLLVAVLSWALEAVGVVSGVPFGTYTYTDALGAWLGPVPLAIPFAWIATVLAALFTARYLLAALGFDSLIARAILGGFLAAAQDFVLEPVATRVQGYWTWDAGQGGVYDVPWQNFVTWFVASVALGFLALLILGPEKPIRNYAWLPPLLLLLATLMFGVLDLVGGYLLAALPTLPILALGLFALNRSRSFDLERKPLLEAPQQLEQGRS